MQEISILDKAHKHPISCLSFSPDQRTMIGCTDVDYKAVLYSFVDRSIKTIATF